jgi:hypothetical protein
MPSMNKLLSLLKSFAPGTQLKSIHLTESNTSLRQLVNHVMTGLLPRNLQQKSFIINDVEKGMLVNNERNILAEVIRRLLSVSIAYTNDNCVHVSANLSGNTTWLNIKTNDTHHNPALTNSLRQVKLMTEKIGGCITVINNNISGTTLAFTFRHREAA